MILTNPWVIGLLHRYFPLVLILQITMFFFDNFFTSYQRMKSLSEIGFKETGTFHADRTNYSPLKCVKEFKKMDRGEYHYFTSGIRIELIRWNDINVVTIGSNAVSVESVENVKRWKWGKGSVNVSQPRAIKAYNKCMGGLDLVNCTLPDLRPIFNGKSDTGAWL